MPTEPGRLAPLPYYKWHWQRFRANRRVQRMDYIARGLYRELLDEQWSEGSLPDNLDELAEICGCPVDVMQDAWRQIGACFQINENGRLFNQVLEDQRTSDDAVRVKNSENGRRGGIQKLLNEQAVHSARQATASDRQASAKRTPSDRHIEEKSREEKSRSEKDVSSEASSEPQSPVIASLPVLDGSAYGVTQAQLDEWRVSYPAIDVMQQLRAMYQWLKHNPKNKKTRSGMGRFIVSWLSKEQNRAPRPAQEGNTHAGNPRGGAIARHEQAKDAIRKAAAAYGIGADSSPDGADEGALSGTGAAGGYGAGMDGALAGDGEGIRGDEVPAGARVVDGLFEVLSAT